jgi:charged multivesicular body protein 4
MAKNKGYLMTNRLIRLCREQALELNQKREALLNKKIAEALAKAREANRGGNKRGALAHLKTKKLYEQELEALATRQLKLQEQVIMLEGSRATAETFGALRTGANAMKALSKETSIDDVDAVMDEINDHTDKMRQVQEALGQPTGMAAEFDEDELEEELAELDALEVEDNLLDAELAAELGEPAMPSVPLPSVPAVSSTTSIDADEEAELRALQAEMELN